MMICWVPEDDAESVKIVDGQHNLSQVEPCPRLCELTLLLLCDRQQQEYKNRSTSHRTTPLSVKKELFDGI